MATLTQITLTCDVCGKAKDVQTRTIGLDGKTYEIDLCPKDDRDLSKATAEYVSNARKITARRVTREKGHRPRSRTETAAIRDWAKASGMKISDRGRVPATVFRDYEAAH
jgi:nucleoid-associated protein Lsr2